MYILLVEYAVPVSHELVDSDVGQGVLDHLKEYLVGYSSDVCACLCGVNNVLRTPEA